MNYKEKSSKFKEMCFKANAGTNMKWKNAEELGAYLELHGGRLKKDKRRRLGYLVCVLHRRGDGFMIKEDLVAEVPMDFAMKVFLFGDFP